MPLQAGYVPHADYSNAHLDNRNVAAKAGGAAAKAAGENQKLGAGGTVNRKKDFDPSIIERIVAEERESLGKLPKYPGLDRFKLIEKMGDGAFSNVYRAKDTTGEYDEVAIKVVRKFEMNSSQVSMNACPETVLSLISFLPAPCLPQQAVRNPNGWQTRRSFEHMPISNTNRATATYIQILRSNQRLSRCAKHSSYCDARQSINLCTTCSP